MENPSATLCEKCGKRHKHRDDTGLRKWCLICINEFRRGETGTGKLIREHIPELYWNASMDDLPASLKAELMKLDDRQGVLLWGLPGRGKTYALMALAKTFIQRGFDIEVVGYDILCSRIRASYQNQSQESEYEIVNSLLKPHKLIIDDVGTTVSNARQETDFSLRIFLTIINERLMRCKPTFFTTNKPLEELGKSFDERVASRLQEICVIFQMTGSDLRSKK